MKYSLRSLMIVVTLVCVVFGSGMWRVRYLKGRARFHRQEYVRIATEQPIYPNDSPRGWLDDAYYHQDMQQAFERAVFRPWTIIDESLPAVAP